MATGNSLEYTPTWAVSIFALFFFLLSFIIEAGLQCLTKFLRRRKRKSLNRALEKSKAEMMKLGFISLLLTVSEVPISKICVSHSVANSFLPCEDPLESVEPAVASATQASPPYSDEYDHDQSNTMSLSAETDDEDQNYCESMGMVSLMSREGVSQLNIFVSVLAVFHVLYCLITMFLGMAKMRRWKAWEDETRTLEYQILNDPRRFQYIDQTSFGKRHLKFWSKYPFLLGPVCLVRQFRGSAISKIDYFTLRNGFISANFAEGSDFNFQKFLARAYDDDFEQVVGVRLWIWIFCILFIFFSAHEFYNHYWLTFIPLGIILVVGTKLQIIITKMGLETYKKNSVIQGSFVVKPNNDLFWFGKPHWLLHLLQFVLIQNSFQLAFFTWTWFEYGQRSCFHRAKEDIAITISMGVLVQFLCGYLTLPLYALVTQMGSGMKRAVFTENVVQGLNVWLKNARRNLTKNNPISSHRPSISWHSDTTDLSNTDEPNKNTPEQQQQHLPTSTLSMTTAAANTTTVPTTTFSSLEITEEEVSCDGRHYHNGKQDITSMSRSNSKPKIVSTRGTYDGEISFGSSWKTVEIGREMDSEITSIIEEDDQDTSVL